MPKIQIASSTSELMLCRNVLVEIYGEIKNEDLSVAFADVIDEVNARISAGCEDENREHFGSWRKSTAAYRQEGSSEKELWRLEEESRNLSNNDY